MNIEIERKFLVRNDSWKREADAGALYIQSYLSIADNRVIRVRLTGSRAFLSLKFASSLMIRDEYEYEIPCADAERIMRFFSDRPPVEKMRHKVRHGTHLWEIDVFTGENEGLVVAEIELKARDETFDRPDWLGEEVTENARYVNAALYLSPFKNWTQQSG